MTKIVLATKILHKGILHSFLEKGGTIIFNKYNFGIEMGGSGDFRELRLITYPETVRYGTEIKTGGSKKKKTIDLNITEDEEEEL